MDEEKKTAFIILRVPQRVKEHLLKQAEKLGKNLSTFVRDKLTDKE